MHAQGINPLEQAVYQAGHAPASMALSEEDASWSTMESASTGAAPSTRATMYPAAAAKMCAQGGSFQGCY